MNTTLIFVLGVGAGCLLAAVLIKPGECCGIVSQGVRDKATGMFGESVGAFGDKIGLWQVAPNLLNLFGVS